MNVCTVSLRRIFFSRKSVARGALHLFCQNAPSPPPPPKNAPLAKPLSACNLLNLLNRFNGSLRTNMHKAAHPSGGMCSSNPRCWRGEQLQHHGEVDCHVVCAFCVVSNLWLVSRTRHTYILEVLQSEPPTLAPYHTPMPWCQISMFMHSTPNWTPKS